MPWQAARLLARVRRPWLVMGGVFALAVATTCVAKREDRHGADLEKSSVARPQTAARSRGPILDGRWGSRGISETSPRSLFLALVCGHRTLRSLRFGEAAVTELGASVRKLALEDAALLLEARGGAFEDEPDWPNEFQILITADDRDLLVDWLISAGTRAPANEAAMYAAWLRDVRGMSTVPELAASARPTISWLKRLDEVPTGRDLSFYELRSDIEFEAGRALRAACTAAQLRVWEGYTSDEQHAALHDLLKYARVLQ